MNWETIELRPLFDLLIRKAEEWDPLQVIPNTILLGNLLTVQIEEFVDGKFRKDRNEAIGFFDAIDKFSQTSLPISLDHFEYLVNDYKNRISPYPHYSGIQIVIPQNLDGLSEVSVENIPSDLKQIDTKENESSMRLL